MRAAVLALLALTWAAGARAQPAPEPPQGEPDAAAEPAGPPSAAARIDANAPTSAYDSRVKQSFAAAESFQGPLDGAWTVSAGGRDLLRLQLVDKGKGQVEGAWRNLREGSTLTASGLLDPTPVTKGAVDAVFGPESGGVQAYRLTVSPAGEGRLAGRLRINEESFEVTVRREP